MKRYIAFVFEGYGSGGGWDDVLADGIDTTGTLLVRSWDTIEEAATAVKQELATGLMNCSQIVDLHTGQVVG